MFIVNVGKVEGKYIKYNQLKKHNYDYHIIINIFSLILLKSSIQQIQLLLQRKLALTNIVLLLK